MGGVCWSPTLTAAGTSHTQCDVLSTQWGEVCTVDSSGATSDPVDAAGRLERTGRGQGCKPV